MTYANRLARELRTTAPGVIYDENLADARDRAAFQHSLPAVSRYIYSAREHLEVEAIENAHEVANALDDWYASTEDTDEERDAFVQDLGWGTVFRRHVEEFGHAPASPEELYEFAAMDLAAAVTGMIRDLAEVIEAEGEEG